MVKQQNPKQSRRITKARRINRGGGREDSTRYWALYATSEAAPDSAGLGMTFLPILQALGHLRTLEGLQVNSGNDMGFFHQVLFEDPTVLQQDENRKAVSSQSFSFLSRLFGKELSCHLAPNQRDSPFHSTWDRRGSVNPWAFATAGNLFLLQNTPYQKMLILSKHLSSVKFSSVSILFAFEVMQSKSNSSSFLQFS